MQGPELVSIGARLVRAQPMSAAIPPLCNHRERVIRATATLAWRTNVIGSPARGKRCCLVAYAFDRKRQSPSKNAESSREPPETSIDARLLRATALSHGISSLSTLLAVDSNMSTGPRIVLF